MKIARISQEFNSLKNMRAVPKTMPAAKFCDKSDILLCSVPAAIYSSAIIKKDDISEQQIVEKLKKSGYEQNEQGIYKRKNFPKELLDFYREISPQGAEIYLDNVTYLQKEHIPEFKKFLSIDPVSAKKMFNHHFETLLEVFCNLKFNSKFNTVKDKNIYAMVKNSILNPPDKETKLCLNNYKGKVYEQGVAKDAQNYLRNKLNNPQPSVQKFINKISSYLDTQTLNTETKLFRGERFYVLENAKLSNGETVNLSEMMQNAAKSGKYEDIKAVEDLIKTNKFSVTQPAFMSATTNRVNEFERDGWIFWELTTQPKTKGAYLEGLNTSFYSFQDEVLLQKGSKIDIQEAKYDKNKNIWYLKGNVSN